MVDLVRQLGLEWPNISTRPVLYFNSRNLAAKDVYWRVFPHQDWRSMQSSLDAIVVWVPLADIPAELGPLDILPGSHLDGLVTDDVVEGFGQVAAGYLTAGKQFVSVPCQGRRDVLAFSSFLVHQSGTNATDGIRWSCHFRYNNLQDRTFIERGYPHNYLYKPGESLLTEGHPTTDDLNAVFRRPALSR